MVFNKRDLYWDGMYLTWGVNRKFVARFKRASDKAGFVSFLVKRFEVQEYFKALETSAPLTVLESKGYVSATVKKLLKRHGYAPTAEGKAEYLNAQVVRNA